MVSHSVNGARMRCTKAIEREMILRTNC